MFYPAETGGVRTYLTAKAHWLAQRKRIDHTVVAPVLADARSETSLVGVPSVPIPYSNGHRIPLSALMTARALRRLQPDLIEVGDPYQFAWTALRVKNEMNVPAVAFYHSDLPRLVGQRFGRIAQRAATRYVTCLYRQFDLVLAPSEVMAQRLRNMGIHQVKHQPLGVDTSVFSPERKNNHLREQIGLSRDTRLLIYAGRFTREKKLPLLINAVERLGHPYHLIMVGSGGELRSSAHVTYLPFQRDASALAGLIASCDVLVHPGDQETFGLVVLEAMACGIPVIGVAAGGVEELIDRDTGLLVAPGDSNALMEGIKRIYKDDLAALGANARRKMLEKYDWSMIIPQLMSHYANLFAARQRAELEEGTLYAID
ncbi:MAG: glycosyltransferase family 1 protein [Herminiimonas sp.]|jgi:alpha-1,6-mannosyltransferase|nr:glycosyltransferase family 1 protein [Herminiimonas sp.]